MLFLLPKLKYDLQVLEWKSLKEEVRRKMAAKEDSIVQLKSGYLRCNICLQRETY